jgi:sensor domain CHASE-containing protein
VIHERSLRIQQKKAEAEAAARREAADARAAERRARVEARMATQQEKIVRAAEEREAREAAYQALLTRTREYAPGHCFTDMS